MFYEVIVCAVMEMEDKAAKLASIEEDIAEMVANGECECCVRESYYSELSALGAWVY